MKINNISIIKGKYHGKSGSDQHFALTLINKYNNGITVIFFIFVFIFFNFIF